MIEGGPKCLVRLQYNDKAPYAESHPRTLKSTTLAHNGDNMEHVIIGRQFLVVMIVFVLSLMGYTVPNVNLWGLNSTAENIF